MPQIPSRFENLNEAYLRNMLFALKVLVFAVVARIAYTEVYFQVKSLSMRCGSHFFHSQLLKNQTP
jgi:hypothetical protein